MHLGGGLLIKWLSNFKLIRVNEDAVVLVCLSPLTLWEGRGRGRLTRRHTTPEKDELWGLRGRLQVNRKAVIVTTTIVYFGLTAALNLLSLMATV